MGYFLSELIYREVIGEMIKVLRNKDMGLKSGHSRACLEVKLCAAQFLHHTDMKIAS